MIKYCVVADAISEELQKQKLFIQLICTFPRYFYMISSIKYSIVYCASMEMIYVCDLPQNVIAFIIVCLYTMLEKAIL